MLLNFKVLNLLIYVKSIMICLGEICIIIVGCVSNDFEFIYLFL